MVRVEPADYFDIYCSNTTAGSGNQYRFMSDGLEHTARIWYRLTCGGEYEYSLLFGNVINSTFSDGSISRKNDVIGGWSIRKLTLAVSPVIDNEAELTWLSTGFQGKEGIYVPEEPLLFASDPVTVTAKAGDFLCVQITYSGDTLPNHEESIISGFLWDKEGWVSSRQMPYPEMIGCSRKAPYSIGYFGDSITQGIGTAVDSYLHWNAVLSDRLGSDIAFWNIGLGYGRAEDAASLGVWMEKACRNDLVVVCFGVNDLHHTERGWKGILEDLSVIVRHLKQQGIKVVLQSVPPFDYTGPYIEKWKQINRALAEELSKEADAYFDTVPVLGDGPNHPERAKYGGHPNEKGSGLWAKALFEQVDWQQLTGLPIVNQEKK